MDFSIAINKSDAETNCSLLEPSPKIQRVQLSFKNSKSTPRRCALDLSTIIGHLKIEIFNSESVSNKSVSTSDFVIP